MHTYDYYQLILKLRQGVDSEYLEKIAKLARRKLFINDLDNCFINVLPLDNAIEFTYSVTDDARPAVIATITELLSDSIHFNYGNVLGYIRVMHRIDTVDYINY